MSRTLLRSAKLHIGDRRHLKYVGFEYLRPRKSAAHWGTQGVSTEVTGEEQGDCITSLVQLNWTGLCRARDVVCGSAAIADASLSKC